MNDGNFKYQLEQGSKKHHCPQCEHKTFVRYVDVITELYLPEKYGRCDREINCTYHLNPYKDGYNKSQVHEIVKPVFKPIKPKPVGYVPFDVFSQSRKGYEQNNFVQWLIKTIGAEGADTIISKYHLGTSNKWSGANVFWQIDPQGKIRTGKIMLYNKESGKRIKEPFSHIYWVHKTLKINHKQIFFGSHLLAEPESITKPVAIVESEKTAVIASHYFKQFVWLACGGLSMLSNERCEHLKGRDVVLWPDLNCLEAWRAKADELGFKCSDYLERSASAEQKQKGLDLADFLTMPEPLKSEKSEKSDGQTKHLFFDNSEPVKSRIEKTDIENLKLFFDDFDFAKAPERFSDGCKLVNPKEFADTYLAKVQDNYGKKFNPYLNRLIDFVDHC